MAMRACPSNMEMRAPGLCYIIVVVDVSHILEDLNDAQREAVAAPPGPVLVLAGAGGNIWFRRFLMRMYMRRYS